MGALTWQPLFWALLLGIVSPVLELIEASTQWQRGSDLIWALTLISVTVIIVRLLNHLLKILTATTPSASASLLTNILSGVGVLVVAIILGYLFNLSFIVLLLALAGAITGLTVLFQDTLNNLVSGVSLTVSNRLAPGDWIRLPSCVEGQVTDIQWDVTIVQQLANNFIVLPNRSITEAELINFDRPSSWLSAWVAVGVSYNSNLAQVEQVTLEEANEIMHEINGDVDIPAPLIRYNAFADFSINFNVVLRAGKYEDQFVLKHEFIKRLLRRYNEEGIVIPFPIRTLDFPSDPPPALANLTQAAGGPQQPPTTTGPQEV
jgi:small-conductance mechanosensitive channel